MITGCTVCGGFAPIFLVQWLFALPVGVSILFHDLSMYLVPVSVGLLVWSYRRHGDVRGVLLGGVGLVVLAVHVGLHLAGGHVPILGALAILADPDRYGPVPFGRAIEVTAWLGFIPLMAGILLDWRAARRPSLYACAPTEYWQRVLTGADPGLRQGRRFLRLLPADPRCKLCHAPFRGPGGVLSRVLGKRQSDQNPAFCGDCLRRTKIGGATLECTVLFADVRGSTGLAERMAPEAFTALMNRFYGAATEVLVGCDALIDKLVGDEVVALFVPGFAGPEHARRAVRAAEGILRATGHADPGGRWLDVGVGVHTGSAHVGAVGSAGRITQITAMGDAMNVGARLASQARAGEALLSAATAVAAGIGDAPLERQRLDLEGRSAPVDVRVLRVSADSRAYPRRT